MVGLGNLSLRPAGGCNKSCEPARHAFDQLPHPKSAHRTFALSTKHGNGRMRGREKRHVKKKESTYLSHRVDVDVVFCVLGMGNEGLNEEMPQDTIDGLYFLRLSCPRLDPRASVRP